MNPGPRPFCLGRAHWNPVSPLRAPLTVLLLCSLLGCGVVGCGGASASGPLAQYGGHAAELFDDVIEPRAVGLELDVAATPRADPILRERTQIGDAVVRVRISTVTAAGYGKAMRHQLIMQTLEKLAGERPPPPTFTVTLDDSSPSVGIVRNLESRLGGKTFIAFVKAFGATVSGPSGEPAERQYHFHMAPDTRDVRDAVAEAIVFAAFQK